MTIADPRFRRLNLENVSRAPRKRGVYTLYADRTLLYIGLATGGEDTIRSRLRAHLAAGSDGVTAYKREASPAPQARRETLLAEHVSAHGEPPPQNAAQA